MGAQSLEIQTLEKLKDFYEKKLVEEGEKYLLYKYYHLGEETDFKKLIHLNKLHKAHYSKNCNVQNFINNQLKLKHKYLDITNERKCEEFDICYNK